MLRAAGTARGAGAEMAHSVLCDLTSVRRQLFLCDGRLDRARESWLPWALNPSAWNVRSQRNGFRKKFLEVKAQLSRQRRPLLESRPTPPPGPVAEPEEGGVAVSVFLCTHNPRPEYLRQTLAALKTQTLPASRWELRLVDNASAPALNGQYDMSWHADGRLLREDKVGKVNALRLAFQQTSAPLIAIVDDDNVLAPDYLENAVDIARRHPGLGAWGGIVELQFEHEPEEWTRKYWTFLAEQKVFEDQVLADTKISGRPPVGAGSCIRREVVKNYFDQLEKSVWRQKLGRTGATLMSGEDTDMVLTAGDMGLGCGFFKALRLNHLIPPSRLTADYLARLSEGIRFSTYVLRMMRDPHDAPPPVNLGLVGEISVDCSAKYEVAVAGSTWPTNGPKEKPAKFTTAFTVRADPGGGVSEIFAAWIFLLGSLFHRHNAVLAVMQGVMMQPSELAGFHAATRDAKKIVVVDLGFLGDTVQLVPALWEIKAHYPKAALHVVSAPVGAEVVQLVPCVERAWSVVLDPRKRTLREQWRLVGDLRREKFDVAFNFPGADRTTILTWLTGAPWRLAHAGGREHVWNRWLITNWAPRQDLDVTVFEQRRQVLAACGFRLQPPRFDLSVGETFVRWAETQVPPGALHISLNSSTPFNEWPVEHYAALLKLLWQTYPGSAGGRFRQRAASANRPD